jgi:putative hydrolase
MGPAIVGLQAGSLVGFLATWVAASFDAGLPQDRIGAMSLVVSNIESLTVEGVDRREVHLWVVANEVAFRATSQLPWIQDHLSDLTGDYAKAAKIDPTKLSGLMMGGTDPADIERALEEAGGIEGLIGGEEAEAPRAELEAFLGAITGCSRLLARRALRDIAPNFDQISEARDIARIELAEQPTIGVGPVSVEVTQLGDAFNQDVEKRYGEGSLRTLWSDPSRMPTAAELRDPTAWAARVLLDGWT